MSELPAKTQLLNEAPGQALMVQNDAAAVARATQEIQAALTIAKKFERDVIKIKSKILEACGRKELAEVAEYEYNRGGTRITGPTIDLLRAIANRWGNVRYGWAEVERRDGSSTIRCFAWDMETNGQSERTFIVKHWRDTRGGGYLLADERDIYELLANQAARRVRACLEEVIDADVVTAAVDRCRETLKLGETVPIADRAVAMLVPFKEFGVTQAMIEKRLGNSLSAVSENQMASLRRVYKAIKDGVGQREDYFQGETTAPDFTPPGSGTAAAAKAGLQQQQTTPPAGPAPATPTPAPTSPAEQPSGFNPLKALRNLLKAGGIKENALLDHWANTGATDGSFGSLEDVMLSMPALVTATTENFGTTAAQIKNAGKNS